MEEQKRSAFYFSEEEEKSSSDFANKKAVQLLGEVQLFSSANGFHTCERTTAMAATAFSALFSHTDAPPFGSGGGCGRINQKGILRLFYSYKN